MSRTHSEHSIKLGEKQIAYQLVRSCRRSMGLNIDQRGLRVLVPYNSAQEDIEKLLDKHRDWVLKKLLLWREQSASPLVISHGLELPVLGKTCQLRILSGGNRAIWLAGDTVLSLLTRPDHDVANLLEKALRERLREYALPIVEHYAKKLRVSLPTLRLSSARTRWGSCSGSGIVRLNWRLIHMSREIVNYVIAHELAHLLEMNHSPRFWELVATIYPPWQEARRSLRLAGKNLPIIQCKQ